METTIDTSSLLLYQFSRSHSRHLLTLTLSEGNVWLHNGTWARGEGYAQDILGDLNAGAGGWTDWNLLLDQEGGPNHEV